MVYERPVDCSSTGSIIDDPSYCISRKSLRNVIARGMFFLLV